MMDALMICNSLKKKISGMVITGEVHSVFRNACNLISDGLFITLLAKNRVMSPGSILLDSGTDFDFRSEGLVQGMNFRLNGYELCFYGAKLVISLKKAQEWDPEVLCIPDTKETDILRGNMDVLEESLKRCGSFSGMEKLVCEVPEFRIRFLDHGDCESDTQMKFIRDRFVCFMKDYITADMEKLPLSCNGVIGFGLGLTPSMDDFVNGLMISNICMSKFQKIQTLKMVGFHHAMIDRSLDRTTMVSSEMLKNGAEGLANDAVKNLLRQLFFGTQETVMDAVRKAVDYGETSGTDTALGVYAGLKLWTNQDNDFGRNLNECLCGD